MSSKIITLAQLTTFMTKLENLFAKKSETLAKSGDTATGALIAHSFQTGTAAANYFQCQKFRGQGNADTYYHAIDFGYAGHDVVDFHEYGGVWNFYKNTSGKSDTGTLVGSIKSTGWNGPVVGNVTGNAATATKLAAAKTLQTNLASTAAESFDGSANITPGVTGTLPVGNGGTGQTSLDKVTVGAAKAVPWAGVTGKPSFATVATSGSYADLTNKPTIPTVPTKVSAFTNDAGYLTTHQSLAAYAKTADVNTALAKKQNTLTFDTTPKSGSTNPVTSGGVYDAIEHLPCILVEDNSTQTLTPIDFQSAVWSTTQPTTSCTVWIEEK